MDDTTRRKLQPGGASLPLGVGDVAPDFELRRTFDESVRLAALTERGAVLLVFYVFDFGPV